LKLSAVQEFADLVPAESGSVNIGDVFTSSDSGAQPTNGSSGRRRSGANRSLFGDGGADVFAAPAAAAPASGGDLFGSASAHSTSNDSRWPSSGGGGAAMAGHDGGRVENLTGQRHENSVLFSLSNLQSLAMPSAKPSTTALPTTAPTAEGSGLIDIRAMAASIGPAPSDGATSTTADDLPSFGAFSPAAPVLLPMPSSSGPPWWIYLVIVGMLGLVGGIGFLAWRVISPKQVVVVKEVQVPVPAPEPSKTVAAKTAGAEDTKKPSTIDEKDLPPRDGQSGKDAKEAKEGGKDEKGGKERHHKSGGGSKETKKASGGEEGGKKPAGPVAAIAEPPRPPKGSLDDLLNGATRSGGRGPKASDDDGKKGGGDSSAGPLAKNALVAGLNSVRPKVSNCYNQFKVPGTAMVNITIGKNGKVSKAEVTGKFAGTPTGQCVEAAVKTASFPPSDGFSTPYPFQLK
jgi:hypothetical protein